MTLTVTGLGLICSVGHGVDAACAAIRAELSLPKEIIHFTVLDEEAQSTEFIKGHPLDGYCEGFVSLGRLMRMALGAVEDLRERGALPDPADNYFWGRTGIIIVTPTLDPERFLDATGDLAQLRKEFADQVVLMLGLPIKSTEIYVIDRGAAGVSLALQLAEQRLTHADRFLIVAVDSYVDVEALEWLDQHNRLKTDANPCGLMPGEAAAAMLVESSRAAQERRAPVLAIVGPAAFEQEPNHFFATSPNSGDALARAIKTVIQMAIPEGRFSGDMIIDLNGEVWRASEWSHAQVRASDLLGPLRLIMPKSCVGDVGAASGVLGVCVAIRGFARGYAKGSRTLVIGSSEHGDVGALLVQSENS